MAKKNRIQKAPAQQAIVVNQISQIAVDRTPKDVGTLRSAQRSAESIVYPSRTRLYDLYSDVEMDAHLTGIINKRIDSVLNKSIRFVKNESEVAAVNKLIDTNEFRDMCYKLLYSKMQGLCGIQFIVGPKFNWYEIPRKHVKIEQKVIALQQSDYEGIPYEDDPFIWVVGKDRDFGLLLQCSFYALIKKGNMADWAQYVEIFGQPVRVIKYDAFDDKTKIELRKVLDEAAGSLVLMIPKQADFEMQDGKQSNGDGQLQERLKNACNDEMSICILGNTETTSSTNGGSLAKSKVQSKEQLQITKSDVKFLLSHLNSEKFLRVLASYGYDVEGGEFVVDKEIDINELQVRAQVDTIVAKQVPIDDDYWYTTYGIPKPKNYEELKAKMEARLNTMDDDTEDEDETDANEDKPNKKVKSLAATNPSRSAWYKLRTALADFFDPAQR